MGLRRVAKSIVEHFLYERKSRKAAKRTCLGGFAPPSVRFFPICFTCCNHFRLTQLAIRTLAKVAPAYGIPVIAIWQDRKDPFTKRQKDALRAEIAIPIEFGRTRYRVGAGAGLPFILSELCAFREIVPKMTAGDYLMKFDSDVLFHTNEVFKVVSASRPECFGSKPPREDGRDDYVQGGCYFVRGDIAQAIVNMPISGVVKERTESHLPLVPEDIVISGLALKVGASLAHTKQIRDAPSEIAQLQGALTHDVSVMHFEGAKKRMMEQAAELILSRTDIGKP
jgi:hypothetical protein